MLATCETMPLCCISVFYLELHVTIEGLLLHSCLIGACCVACHPYDKVHMAIGKAPSCGSAGAWPLAGDLLVHMQFKA